MKTIFYLIIFFFVFLFLCLPFSAFAQGNNEQLTITTYYPSPYGSYDQLQTNNLQVKTITIPRSNPQNGYVLASTDTNGTLTWQSAGVQCPGQTQLQFIGVKGTESYSYRIDNSNPWTDQPCNTGNMIDTCNGDWRNKFDTQGWCSKPTDYGKSCVDVYTTIYGSPGNCDAITYSCYGSMSYNAYDLQCVKPK